jgi:release factor glutamine methyltransferase
MSAAPEERWTVRKVISWTSSHFEKQKVDAPRLTAEMLLAHLLNTDRVKLYVDLDRPLEKSELAAYRGLIQRRISGEPTQYLVGNKQFYNRRFAVDPRVLIPRPETELLVEAVLREVPEDAALQVLDLCTGSGCIGITLACERMGLSVTLVDVSPGACEVATANAAALGAADRVNVLQGDLFAPLPAGQRYAVITANAPYVKSAELKGLQREVQKEPTLALDGGPEGLTVIARIAAEARAWLEDGGRLALEIGDAQGPQVKDILVRAGYRDVVIERDLARLDRLAFARK